MSELDPAELKDAYARAGDEGGLGPAQATTVKQANVVNAWMTVLSQSTFKLLGEKEPRDKRLKSQLSGKARLWHMNIQESGTNNSGEAERSKEKEQATDAWNECAPEKRQQEC